MTTNPHILSPDILECPKDCPFLGKRTFMPETLPFYCNQYECFLGANNAHTPLRSVKCRGVLENIVETGLSLIDSYTVDHYKIENTKRAFMRLEHAFQKMFVSLVSQTGVQIVFDETDENPDSFIDAIVTKRKEMKDKYGSPEAQEFKSLLDADGMPLMTRQTKTLLMNLFLVMDNSEKEMIKNIIQNSKQIENFLEKFHKQPQDDHLLKNVRALVYDYDRKRQQELELIRAHNRQQELDLARQREQQRQQLRLRQLQIQRQNIREHHR